MIDKNDLLKKLQESFGLSDLRDFQATAIDSVLAHRDGLVVVPTGGGKSLCYQLPALVFEGLTLVVSPLIALMEDQVQSLKKLGVEAATLHSKMKKEGRQRVYSELRNRKLRILYVTPERFGVDEFWGALDGQKIELMAVDEAHCISQWGHDFRPDYRRLAEIRERLGQPSCLALTATATPETQADIIKNLALSHPFKVLSSVRRDNLSLEVIESYGLDSKIRAFVGLFYQLGSLKSKSDRPASFIVYFSLVETLRKFAVELERMSIGFVTYHGQLKANERHHNQKVFLNDGVSIMLATPAFGLGVDKPNVRAVIHTEIPGSVEAYFQEAGRGGRDGYESHCILLYDVDDVSIASDFIKWSHPEPEFIRQVYRQLSDYKFRSVDELRRKLLFYHSRDFRLETTLNLLEDAGVISDSDQPRSWEVQGEIPEELNDEDLRSQLLKASQRKLLHMINYADSKECRMILIQDYFGEPRGQPCGKCDNCRRTIEKS